MTKVSCTIGVTGGSGAGKTFFIKELAKRFDPRDICLISQDHYYKPLEKQQPDTQGVENLDLPSAIDHEQFCADIRRLKQGEVMRRREYTFNNPAARPAELEFKPAPVLIVEGLFIQYFPEIDRELDLSIFIDAKDHLKLARRIRRDSEERGYGLEDVLYRYQYHVMPVYESSIEPLNYKADLIVPNNRHFERALEWLVYAIKGRLSRG
jgi:uridine kinase